jgi:phosphatidylglycerol:prolipoprotein diacylglycerol transferase
VIPWVLVGALVGARLYHVLDYLSYYSENWLRVFELWQGGLAIWGGVMGGMVAYAIRIQNLEFRNSDTAELLAALVVPLPLAQAIGRIGNGVNGEFGELIGRVPWWSAEMGADLLLALCMYLMCLRGSSSQVKVGVYLVGYGVIRFGLEFARARSWELSGLGVAQWVAAAAIVIGFTLIGRSILGKK